MAIPGLKVVAPSTPADVARPDGRPRSATRTRSSSARSKALLATKGEVPDGEHVVPLGQAAIVREGGDCTIVALASMVPAGRRGRRAARGGPRDRGRGHRPAHARPARRRDDPRLGREDEPAVHRRGEPAAAAAGAPRSCRSSPTRASTASTRRSSGSPRRTSRSPSAAGPRGRGAPDGRPHRRHGPSPARGREVTDGDATRPSGSSARAGWARRWRGRSRGAGRPLVAPQPEPRPGGGARGRARRARGRDAAPRSPRRADVTITMLADDDAVAPGLRRRRRAARRARAAARSSSTCSTVTPDALRAFDAGRAGRRRRAARRAGQRLDGDRGVGPADAHGRRRGGRPRAGAARARAAGEDDLPPRARWAPAPP